MHLDFEILRSLVRIVELKDQSTAAHTWRVTLYAQALAEAAGRPLPDIKRIMHGAVLHDIGKIDIPYDILAKPARLTDEEFAVIKTHTVLGHERLRRMGVTDPLILDLVRSHHERLDGSGYPDGLAGEAVPIVARYFAVIDSFDAMTSLRPYRRVTGREAGDKAIAELRDRSSDWYCPDAVGMFAGLYERGALDWILEHFNDEESLEGIATEPDPDVILRAGQEIGEQERRGQESREQESS